MTKCELESCDQMHCDECGRHADHLHIVIRGDDRGAYLGALCDECEERDFERWDSRRRRHRMAERAKRRNHLAT